MPRFVVLEHDWPHPHFDLMLEDGGVLKTWRLAAMPGGTEEVEAEPIGDHRLDYLDYEGPVSAGRGTVRRWDRGDLERFEIFENDRISLTLKGERLNGAYGLFLKNGKWIFR